MKKFRVVLTFLVAALLVAAPAKARPLKGGGSIAVVGKTTANIDAAYLIMNVAQSTAGGTSAQTGWPGTLNANGYPTSATTSPIGGNDLQFFPGYFGRYKWWWTSTGAFQINTGSGYIVYSGGTGTNVNAATGVSDFSLEGGYSGATAQPTSAAPIEFAHGMLVSAVANGSSCAGGTAGLVCLTLTDAVLNNLATGQLAQINNVTNLSPGPWTLIKLDNTHAELQGSVFSGTMAVVGGGPGPQSEMIFNTGTVSWAFPGQGSSGAGYSTMGGMVICRSQNISYGGLSDCGNIGAHYANIDYVNTVKSGNPRWARLLDITGTINSFATSFTYRPTTSNFQWSLNNFVPPYWGGVLTDTSDAYTVPTNPSASPASGPPVDGEIVIASVGAVANTTTRPTLTINRSGYGAGKPILGITAAGLTLTMAGTVPPIGTTISFPFTGGGLSSSFTYHYVTVSGDTSFSAIGNHILSDINTNGHGNSGALITAGIVAQGNGYPGSQLAFGYNPNINSSGSAALGNGLTITGSDSASSASYDFGYVNAGYLTAGDGFTFTYSAIAGGWISQDSGTPGFGGTTSLPGVKTGPPLEVLEDFGVQSGVGLWLDFSPLYSDTAVTSTCQHIGASGVKELVVDWSNETWNPGPGGQWALVNYLGQYLGLPSSYDGGPSNDDYTGLREIQIAAACRTGWANAGRSQSQLFIDLAYQFVSPSLERFNGTHLTPSSNVTLAAYGDSPSNGTTTPSGWSTNSSAFPNRPRDWSDFLSPAVYWNGDEFNSVQGLSINTSVPLASYNCALVASYNYVNGNSTEQTAAVNFMFNGTSGDFYELTGLNGSVNNQGQLATWAHGSGNSAADYFGITSIVAADDTLRTGTNPHTGLAWEKLGVGGYEGDNQPGPINSTDEATVAGNLTTLGDTSGYTSGLGSTYCGMAVHGGGPTSSAASDASNMAALLFGFKNSTQYEAMYLRYFNDFVTAINSQGARLAVPATYGFQGTAPYGGYWSKFPGSLYTTPAFQSWNAIQQFNH